MARLAGGRLVDLRRLTEYLLNENHPVGGSKARFFVSRGFEVGDVAVFAEALDRHAQTNEIVSIEMTAYGMKTVIDCFIPTPDGVDPCIRTVWQCDSGADVHRLITAHPNS